MHYHLLNYIKKLKKIIIFFLKIKKNKKKEKNQLYPKKKPKLNINNSISAMFGALGGGNK